MLLLTHRDEEASEACDRALALDPDFAEAYRNRALIDDRLARADLLRADGDRFALLTRFLGPAQAEKLDLQSLLTGILGRSIPKGSRVEDLARKVAAADRSDVDARVVEANTPGAARRGRAEEAIALLDGVLRDHPDHLLARYNRAGFLKQAGRPEALAEYRALIDDPRFEELYRVQPGAVCVFAAIVHDLIRLGRPAEALAMARSGLDEALRTGLYPADAHYAVARAHAAMDQADLAREQLQLAVGLNPKLATAYARDRLFADLHRADPEFLSPAMAARIATPAFALNRGARS